MGKQMRHRTKQSWQTLRSSRPCGFRHTHRSPSSESLSVTGPGVTPR